MRTEPNQERSRPAGFLGGEWAHIARRFAPYLQPRWRGLALASVGMLGQTAADLAAPWPLKLVIDVLLGKHHAPLGIAVNGPSDRATFLVAITAAIVGLAMLDGLFSYWREYSLSRTGQELAFDLRTTLYAHVQRLSFGFYESQRTGDLIKRVTSDIDSIQEFLTDSMLTLISSVLTITSMLLVMLWMDSVLALAAFALAPVLFAVVYRYTSLRTGVAGAARFLAVP